MSNTRAATYAEMVRSEIGRLIGSLDREPESKTYGCFDREFWAWKFRDFPITMLQAGGYVLAQWWNRPIPRNQEYHHPRVAEWIDGAMRYTIGRQRPNGAFDSVGPYTQDHGVSLAMVYLLAGCLKELGDAASPETRERTMEAIRRACRFATRSEEDYAFVSNHHALFALAWRSAHDLLGDQEALHHAEATVDQIIAHQSADGWYGEYGGPDPGYETLGISYLSLYWKWSGSTRVLDSLRKSVEFWSHCVHPDGSLGGVYGSRHTGLYCPDGFERLAEQVPLAASVAAFVTARLPRANAVTPSSSDSHNLAILLRSYLDAWSVAVDRPDEPPTGPELPCRTFSGLRHFGDSQITVAGAGPYYAVVNGKKGGVTRIFDRHEESLVYEDAGYRCVSDRATHTSQLLGLSTATVDQSAGTVTVAATFGELRQELPTPGRFLVLRLLNLTLFRHLGMGKWLRRQIIRRLVTAGPIGPLSLERVFRFAPTSIEIRDHIFRTKPIVVRELHLERALTGIHMGSAKYFHQNDLSPQPEAPLPDLSTALNDDGAIDYEFSLNWEGPGGPKLAPGPLFPVTVHRSSLTP